MAIATENLPEARTTLPDLYDSDKYVRIERAPLFNPHVRHVRRNGKVVEEEVTSEQLATIAANSQRRFEAGDPGLLFVGHTNTDKKVPEKHQPPLIGYVGNFQLGQFRGKPTIIADFFVERPETDKLKQFPRRSIEIFGKLSDDGYIDAVALLKRAPELDLGIVTYQSEDAPEIYLCDHCQTQLGESESNMDENIPDALVDKIVDKVVERLLAAFEDAAEPEAGSEPGPSEPGPSGPSEPGSSVPETFNAGVASGTNTMVPSESRSEGEMYGKVEIEALVNQAVAVATKPLKDQITSLQGHNEQLRQQTVRERRLRELYSLHDEGYEFDPAERIERFAKLSEEDYQERLTEIREHYSKRQDTGDFIPTAEPERKSKANQSELTADEIAGNAVEQFAKAHPEIDRNQPAALVLAYLQSPERLAKLQAARKN